MKTRGRLFTICFTSILLFAMNVSCVTIKRIEYFNDFEKFAEPVANPKTQKTIKPFDKLSVIILSTDQQTAQILNFAEESMEAGYVVDESGNIEFPFVGKINIGGMTTQQASAEIRGIIGSVVSNPVVLVRYLDQQVTVLGEVYRQGVYPISREKINIYEALALGGGITEWGDRRKIVLMRVINNEPRFFPLDLSNSEIAYNEFFYVQPNDVVFVEPMRAKVYRNSFYRDIVLTITGLITTLVVYTRGNIF